MGVWEGTHWRTGVVPFDIIAGHRESSLTMSKCSLSCPSGQAYIQVNSGVDQTPARSPALPLGLCWTEGKPGERVLAGKGFIAGQTRNCILESGIIPRIHPSVELNIKMSGTASKLGAEGEQGGDRRWVASRDLTEEVELDPSVHLWEQSPSAFLHAPGYEGNKPEAPGAEEVAIFWKLRGEALSENFLWSYLSQGCLFEKGVDFPVTTAKKPK